MMKGKPGAGPPTVGEVSRRRLDAFVGRQPDLDLVLSATSGGAVGRPSLLLISGEAGIGKTRLVEEAATVAATSGARVLWSACWESGGPSPFWPWLAVLRQCRRDESDDALIEAALTPDASDLLDHRRVEWFEAIADFLGKVSRPAPLLIVLDDLHLADASSITLLRFLAGALRVEAVSIVATYRYPDLPPDSALASAQADVGRVGRVHQLGGLSIDEVRELVQSVVSLPVERRLVREMASRTGGNPLFVAETARLLAARGGLASVAALGDLPVPHSVRQVVSERLGFVSGECLDLLGDAAVLGEHFDVALLRRITDVQGADVQRLLDEAADAELLHRVGPTSLAFSHAIVREVLYAGIPAGERRELHRLAGDAVAATGGGQEAADVAHHLYRAVPAVDARAASDASRRAGEVSLRALAYEEATLHFRRALELIGDDEDGIAVELLLSLGEALMRGGDWDQAAEVYEHAAALGRRRGRPDEVARAALGMGAALSGFEVRLHHTRQLALLREALDGLGEDDELLRAWLVARLSVAASFVDPVERRVELSRQAIDAAHAAGDDVVLGYALASYCDAVAGPAHSEERLATAVRIVDLALSAKNPELELLGRRLRVVALLELGDLSGMADEVDRFAATAHELRHPLFQWCVPVWRGTLALVAGRLDESERLCERARHWGERAGSVNAALVVEVQGMQRRLERGEFAGVLDALRPFLEDPEGGPNAEAWLVLPLALLGRRAEARAVLDRFADRGFQLVVDAAWLEVIAGLAEGCAELGDAAAAATLYSLIEPHADRFATGATGGMCLGSLHRHLGLLAACQGLFDVADGHFRQALAAHRRTGAALLVAHTQRQHAETLRRRGEPGDDAEAHRMSSAALAAYQELRIARWAAPEPGASAATGARSSSKADNVFRREGQVWELAYNGTTTRVSHAKGIAVLARLLAAPRRAVHVLDLIERPPASGTAPRSTAFEDLRPPGALGEILDAKARDQYRQRLINLEQEIDDASSDGNTEQAARLKAERDFLTDELAHALGFGGRARITGDPAERARWAVTKQVRNAIARIDKVHPDLARHLKASVRTGRFCTYEPEHPTEWML